MAIEIVDFPIKNGGSFHSYVNVYQRVVIPSYSVFIWPRKIIIWTSPKNAQTENSEAFAANSHDAGLLATPQVGDDESSTGNFVGADLIEQNLP